MNIADVLKLKYPEADILKDIIIQDDGQGPYIKEWNIPDVPKPDKATLDTWAIEVQNEYELQQVIISRAAEYPTKEELIIALWEAQVENRLEALQTLQAERLAIKAKYPKPVEGV